MSEFRVTLPQTPGSEHVEVTDAEIPKMQRLARQFALDHQRAMLQNAEDAQAALDAGDYSRAAMHCHRAHQEKLMAETLRAVLI